MKFFRRAPKDPSPEEVEAEAARTLELDPEMGLLADFVTGQLDEAGNAVLATNVVGSAAHLSHPLALCHENRRRCLEPRS